MIDENDPDVTPEDEAGTEETADPQAENEAETPEEEAGEGSETSQSDDKQDPPEEFEIVVAGEKPAPKEKDNAAFARMRQRAREIELENAALKQRLQAQSQPVQTEDPGQKPKWEDCGYDQDAYDRAMDVWRQKVQRKADAEAHQAKQLQTIQQRKQSRADLYAQGAAELTKQFPKFPESHAAVLAAFDVNRQDVLLAAVKNPALVVHVLGQRPSLLAELAKEEDGFALAGKLRELEVTVKVQKKTTQAPPPESKVRGSGSVSGSTADPKLDALRAKAAETGDYTKVREHKAAQDAKRKKNGG